MVFKKPYAFFIKYFKLIHLILSILLGIFAYNLNNIHNVLKSIYMGKESSYGTLSSTYINFFLIFLIFLIALLLSAIIILLKQKKKPMKDYIFAAIYVVIIIIYLFIVNSLFNTLISSVVEQTTLKVYSDISFILILPIFYFIFKFILITIGFNLKKFNFQKDIIELKQEENDNEEVELIFDKNTYKYKRKARRILRELKYYYMENKGLINTIFISVILVGFILLIGKFTFKTNTYKLGKEFSAGNFSFTVNNVYETEYNMNYKKIKEGYKFVIANINIRNNGQDSLFDFNKIRLMYGKDYSYSNNYFNSNFIDLGIPYNKEVLSNSKNYNYIFIFEVPNTYKKHKYSIRIFDTNIYEEEDINSVYKTVKVKTTNLDSERKTETGKISDKIIFNQNIYGNSNIIINDYSIKNSYTYNKNNKVNIIKSEKANYILLILDYKLDLDKNKNISSYFNNDLSFLKSFLKVEYNYNGKNRLVDNIDVLDILDGKVFVAVPYEVNNADSIDAVLSFRDTQIKIKLK